MFPHIFSSLACCLLALPVLAAPANDDFANAELIPSSVPIVVSGSNVNATEEDDEPYVNDYGRSTVWYKWTPPRSGIFTALPKREEGWCMFLIYTGDSLDNLRRLPLFSDYDASKPSSFAVMGGQEYYISVDGYQGDQAAFTLELNAGPDTLEDGGDLTLDDYAFGQISDVGETDIWTFDGEKDRVYTLAVGEYSTESLTEPALNGFRIQVVDLSGNEILSREGAWYEAFEEIRLPEDGKYQIKISALDDTDLGLYNLALYDATPDVLPVSLFSNATYANELESMHSLDRWTFHAEAGQVVKWNLVAQTGGSVTVRILGPDGWTGYARGGSGTILPVAGDYVLEVSLYMGSKVTYGFRFWTDVEPEMVDLIAHCELRGVVIPDGAFTDNGHVNIVFQSEYREKQIVTRSEGGFALEMNGDLSAGVWKASGVLQGLAGVPDGEIRVGGKPVVIDTRFSVPFRAPVGVGSRVVASLSMNGRRVHKIFSDQEVILPEGSEMVVPQQRGFFVTGISVVNSDKKIVTRFIPPTTTLDANSHTVGEAIRLSQSSVNSMSTTSWGPGDAKVWTDAKSSISMQAYSYMGWTIFGGSTASLGSRDGPNFLVYEDVPQVSVRPEISGKTQVTLGLKDQSGDWVEIQTSVDLKKWKPLMKVKPAEGESSLDLGSFSDKGRYFRVVPASAP